jgi:pectinesterase
MFPVIFIDAMIFSQGATDFIFGGGTAYFQNNVINVVGTGWITASGRETDDDTSCR